MIIERNLEQGSDEWLQARCGVVTMSHAKDLLTGGKGITRRNYLLDVAAERMSEVPSERVKTWDMIRGNELEPYALEAYVSETRADVETVGLGFLNEDRRVAASPDALIKVEGFGGAEIKCPNPRKHMRYIDSGIKEHMPQIIGNMWVFGATRWHFVSFCPEFEPRPLFITAVQMDEVLLSKLIIATESALVEINEIVEQATAITYRNRDELNEICASARQALEFIANNGEVRL